VPDQTHIMGPLAISLIQRHKIYLCDDVLSTSVTAHDVEGDDDDYANDHNDYTDHDDDGGVCVCVGVGVECGLG
jgi:hypothetical protein